MPPGAAYNWLTVAHSALQVLDHALKYRAAQVQLTRLPTTRVSQNQDCEDNQGVNEPASPPQAFAQQSSLHQANEAWLGQLQIAATLLPPLSGTQEPNSVATAFSTEAEAKPPGPLVLEAETNTLQRNDPLPQGLPAQDALPKISVHSTINPLQELSPHPESERRLQSSKVPSSRIGRLFHYGGLAASLGYGAASEYLRRSTTSTNSTDPPPSLMMTEAKSDPPRVEAHADAWCSAEGWTVPQHPRSSFPPQPEFKLTWVSSDTHVLPPELDRVFRRVQDSAHYMPNWQMEGVMTSSLGPAWRSSFTGFQSDTIRGCLDRAGQPEHVAVKIQFPNIAESVSSDLGYIRLLLTAGRLLPRGLFLRQDANGHEGRAGGRMQLRAGGGLYALLRERRKARRGWPLQGPSWSTLMVPASAETQVHRLPQADRDETDPNWSNFLWNAKTRQVELVDFGATRSYSHAFIDNWLRLLLAAAGPDREGCLRWSLELGYLTGEENDMMNDAHVESLQLLATPFRKDTPQPFAFGPGSTWAGITADIRERIPVMLDHRLTPPPRETYSLNRKLSGTFLLASRLQATVDCRKLWDGVVDDYKFSTNPS
ncbi:ABC1-domain-containing protein [Lactarius indigo]|nr:ABC1-domain-containing protein [Lactarius indigo]